MPRSRPPYPAEFRRQMIELVQTGCTPGELSHEVGVTSQSISARAAFPHRRTHMRSPQGRCSPASTKAD